jgi:hypothetical protein
MKLHLTAVTAWYFDLQTGPMLPVAAVLISLGALLSRRAGKPSATA